MYVLVCMNVLVCLCVYVWMCVCMYVRMCMCVYVCYAACMYSCMYVQIEIHAVRKCRFNLMHALGKLHNVQINTHE